MEVLGERWSLLVIRELMLGGRRFSDLRASLPGISAKVLTERLESLEAAGVVTRRRLPSPGKVQIYELTEWGYRAEPAIQELGRWAAMSPDHDPLLPLSPVSFMLSLRTMFDPAKAVRLEARIGFAIAGENFVAQLTDGTMTIARESAFDGVDAAFHAPQAPLLAALFYANIPPEELEGSGLVIAGDRARALAFAGIFELPDKIA